MNNTPCGIVFNSENKVLLVFRRFAPLTWGPPGGYPNYGEEPMETVEREVSEETGISCVVLAPLGDYDYPEYGSRLNLYVCSYLFGTLRCSYESKNLGWFALDELPNEISPPKEVFQKAFELYKLSIKI